MRRYDTAIFDLDGTLLDTLQDLADSTNYALAAHHLPARSQAEIRAFVGNGVGALISRAVPPNTPAETVSRCLNSFRAHYADNMAHKTAPYPGILALLHTLRTAGFRLAVVSNKFDSAVKTLCQTFFDGLIPVAIGEAPNVAKKPAPDTVFRALTALGADPARAVYIGDSEVDLATAQNAGLPCLSVSWGFKDPAFLADAGACTIVAAPEALLPILLAEL